MLLFCRVCFFTTSDAKSTRKFVKVLNESLESGSVMCQLQDPELDKYVMNITTQFCRQQRGRAKSEYVKKSGRVLGEATWIQCMGAKQRDPHQ